MQHATIALLAAAALRSLLMCWLPDYQPVIHEQGLDHHQLGLRYTSSAFRETATRDSVVHSKDRAPMTLDWYER